MLKIQKTQCIIPSGPVTPLIPRFTFATDASVTDFVFELQVRQSAPTQPRSLLGYIIQ